MRGETVYILFTGEYELRGTAGVFASVEAAQRACELDGEWESLGDYRWVLKRPNFLGEGADIESWCIQ